MKAFLLKDNQMKDIQLNEEFSFEGNVFSFVKEESGKNILKFIRKPDKKKSKTKEFIPPTLDEVKAYFKAEGYMEEIAEKAFKHYERGNWHNSKGKKVLNWKQTMGTNWMKDEYKIKETINPAASKDKMVR